MPWAIRNNLARGHPHPNRIWPFHRDKRGQISRSRSPSCARERGYPFEALQDSRGESTEAPGANLFALLLGIADEGIDYQAHPLSIHFVRYA